MKETMMNYQCILSFKTQKLSLSCLAISDTTLLLYAAASNEISVFDLLTYKRIDSFNGDAVSSGFVKSIVFDPCDSNKVFTAHQDCKIRVWEVAADRHRLLWTLPTFADRLLHFASPRSYVSVKRHKKRLRIEHSDAVSGLAVSRQGLMFSVSWDRSFKIWNTRNSMRCLESTIAHEDAINAIVASDNGTIYTGSADGLIRVWAKDEPQRRHKLINTLDKHTSSVNALALNAGESVLFSGGGDHQIIIWQQRQSGDTDHMAFLETLQGHNGAVLCLTAVNGDLLVSGSSDRTVRMWRHVKCAGYCCVGVIEGHERPVKSLASVPTDASDERVVRICSGSLDGEIKLWEIST